MEQKIKSYLACTCGAVLFVFGVNCIITPAGLYNGGFVGIGQLVKYLLVQGFDVHSGRVDLAGLVYFVLNVPLFVLAYRTMSRSFFYKTLYTVLLQTVLLALVPIPAAPVIKDSLTACCVGGVLSGAGVGIILLANSSGGGQDILGLYFSNKISGFSVGKLAFIINFFVYGCCLFLFDIETVVYSLIYTVIMSVVMDRIHTQNINTTVIILTKKEGIEDFVIKHINRGVTVWKGMGGYTKDSINIALVVLSRHEIHSLKNKLHSFDSSAFCIVGSDISVYGNYERRLGE